ncbi:unnamed protein product [[Candida] boidinii]|nr:unnamed protein product [[Candida] boidinii]GMF47754.1 unnamed protein product [[Candida] boidinii]
MISTTVSGAVPVVITVSVIKVTGPVHVVHGTVVVIVDTGTETYIIFPGIDVVPLVTKPPVVKEYVAVQVKHATVDLIVVWGGAETSITS